MTKLSSPLENKILKLLVPDKQTTQNVARGRATYERGKTVEQLTLLLHGRIEYMGACSCGATGCALGFLIKQSFVCKSEGRLRSGTKKQWTFCLTSKGCKKNQELVHHVDA